MYEWILPIHWVSPSFFQVGQYSDAMIEFINPRSFNLFNLSLFIVGILLLVGLIIAVLYAIQRRRNFLFFLEQLQNLGLNTEEESTFVYMVRRYSLSRPVRALRSPKVFDEMASHEMLRVLCGDASQGTKEKFIDTVYKIRTVTHLSACLSTNESD